MRNNFMSSVLEWSLRVTIILMVVICVVGTIGAVLDEKCPYIGDVAGEMTLLKAVGIW